MVGNRSVVIVDPGPDVEHHVRALVSSVQTAESVAVVLTHGHSDHAASAPAISRLTGANVYGPEGLGGVDVTMRDGDAIETDAGDLVAVHTPGHTPEHLSFWWTGRDALFVGDLFLGKGDTTWVAEYPGCVADYLQSLRHVRGLSPSVMYPSHGPPLEDPIDAIDRFEAHRLQRIEQVRTAMRAHPAADTDALLDVVYGPELASGLRGAASRSLAALVEFIHDGGTP